MNYPEKGNWHTDYYPIALKTLYSITCGMNSTYGSNGTLANEFFNFSSGGAVRNSSVNNYTDANVTEKFFIIIGASK